ncbi:UDP-N-acetylglucosamine transferase subunit ALG14 homolog isoform X1 [Leopardus geoffroyi]|uniref:UDP-N-acetylglucosamine transferase subunit ALG14 homolog isoform X1 n=1 Tax=Leopardus geoffroyi TaxID=46844 RepID=UPI001E25DD19|nr:UDP-N-acetylglucosamine transferase subunit ALG14 homolog isoform X1 [Leopardus geoffroyi]
MVSVFILAAAGAAVAVLFLALRLWVVLHSRVLEPRQSLSLLVVAGSGGHTTEILRLLEHLSNAYSPRHYIIADTDEMSAHKINSFERNRADRDPSTMFPEYFIHRIPRSREVQQSWLSTVLTTLYSMWLSFPLTHRVKPDLHMRLFASVLPTVELLSILESILSNPDTALSCKLMSYSQSFAVISTVFTASSPGVDFISRNHCLCSFINNSSSVKVLS